MLTAENEEVIALLREIRDLQQAHFERYKEFTTAAIAQGDQAMQRQRESLGTLADSRSRDEQFRQAQLAFQQQVMADTAKSRTTAILVAACTGVLQVVLIAILAFIALLMR
jgi:hypothetical protein